MLAQFQGSLSRHHLDNTIRCLCHLTNSTSAFKTALCGPSIPAYYWTRQGSRSNHELHGKLDCVECSRTVWRYDFVGAVLSSYTII